MNQLFICRGFGSCGYTDQASCNHAAPHLASNACGIVCSANPKNKPCQPVETVPLNRFAICSDCKYNGFCNEQTEKACHAKRFPNHSQSQEVQENEAW
jgi:hypothetical protein